MTFKIHYHWELDLSGTSFLLRGLYCYAQQFSIYSWEWKSDCSYHQAKFLRDSAPLVSFCSSLQLVCVSMICTQSYYFSFFLQIHLPFPLQDGRTYSVWWTSVHLLPEAMPQSFLASRSIPLMSTLRKLGKKSSYDYRLAGLCWIAHCVWLASPHFSSFVSIAARLVSELDSIYAIDPVLCLGLNDDDLKKLRLELYFFLRNYQIS